MAAVRSHGSWPSAGVGPKHWSAIASLVLGPARSVGSQVSTMGDDWKPGATGITQGCGSQQH